MTLQEFFQQNREVAIAFSGGVDSAYLLREAVRYAQKVKAYYVKSAFQPAFELEDAMIIAGDLGVRLEVLELQVLENPQICENPENRCYFCKQAMFRCVIEAAGRDGFRVIADGTNASDAASDRPGMRALEEMQVLSPLRMCGLTKTQIRMQSKEEGLPTWDKPAYACLATRIPTGERITDRKIRATEFAETYLRGLGFSDLRVRAYRGHARIQLPEEQWERFVKCRREVLEALKPYYETISLDLEVRYSER